MANKIKSNGSYGIALINSSPSFSTSALGIPNVIRNNKMGLWCDSYSAPRVRGSKFLANTLYGALVESNGTVPDFGTAGNSGGNAFQIFTFPPPTSYRHLKYTRPIPQLQAWGNWWGQPLPDPALIEGNINYSNPLGWDPLPGFGRRDPGFEMLPSGIGIAQNYPNPFNPQTTIRFYLAQGGYVNLKVYNLTGQLVRELASGLYDSGEYALIWDGRNEADQDVASGVYFYMLSTEVGKITKRMTLLR
jgi:hypothetical protein